MTLKVITLHEKGDAKDHVRCDQSIQSMEKANLEPVETRLVVVL